MYQVTAVSPLTERESTSVRDDGKSGKGCTTSKASAEGSEPALPCPVTLRCGCHVVPNGNTTLDCPC